MHICQQYFSARSILWWTGKYIVPFISSVPLLTYRHASLFFRNKLLLSYSNYLWCFNLFSCTSKNCCWYNSSVWKKCKVNCTLSLRETVCMANKPNFFRNLFIIYPFFAFNKNHHLVMHLPRQLGSRYLLKSSSSRRGYWAFLPVHFCFYLFAFCFFPPTIQFLNCFLPILNLFVVCNRFLPLL